MARCYMCGEPIEFLDLYGATRPVDPVTRAPHFRTCKGIKHPGGPFPGESREEYHARRRKERADHREAMKAIGSLTLDVIGGPLS